MREMVLGMEISQIMWQHIESLDLSKFIESFTFGDVVTNETAAGTRKHVWINSTDNTTTNPALSIENVTSFFGMKKNEDSGSPNRNFEIECPPKLAEIVTRIDDHVKAHAVEHSKSWFGGAELSSKEIDSCHISALTQNEKYPARLKIKVTPKTRVERVVSQDDNSMICTEAEAESALIAAVNIKAIAFRVQRVWFMGSNDFGVVFTADRILVQPASGPSFYFA